jgi:hypothetical protein
MPDGHQDRSFNYTPPNPQNISAQPFNIPGATKPAGGVNRAINFVRGLSGKAVVFGVVVFGLQAVMPQGSKPSDLIGSFHGATESAELKAKQETAAEYERKLADAKAAPPANWQMEQALNQTQLQAQLKALETQEQAAQVADLACMGSGFVTGIFGDTRDARAWRDLMKQGCHEADRIRAQINEILARTARQGSGVVQRSNPATGAASPPALTSPAFSR